MTVDRESSETSSNDSATGCTVDEAAGNNHVSLTETQSLITRENLPTENQDTENILNDGLEGHPRNEIIEPSSVTLDDHSTDPQCTEEYSTETEGLLDQQRTADNETEDVTDREYMQHEQQESLLPGKGTEELRAPAEIPGPQKYAAKPPGPPEGPPTPGVKAPDGGWGWVIIVATVMSHIIYGVMVRSFGVIFLELLARYKGTPSATGWIGAINIAACGVLGPVTSSLCVKFSHRSVTIVGGVVMAIGVAVSAFSPNLTLLYISYGLVAGAGLSMTYTPGFLIIGQYFEKRRALAMGIANFGTGIGTLCFPPLMIMLFDQYGYQGALLILAGLCLQCCVSGALFRPLEKPKLKVSTVKQTEMVEIRNGKPVENEEEELMEGNGKPRENSTSDLDIHLRRRKRFFGLCLRKKTKVKEKSKKPPLFDIELMKDKRFVGTCIVLFSAAQALALTSGFLPAMAVERGISPTNSAFLLSISGISSSVGGLVLGALMDMKKIKPYRVNLFSFYSLMVAVNTILNPVARTYWEFVILCIFRAGFAGVMVAQRATVVADLVGPRKVPNAFGWLLFFYSVGSLFGRSIGGTLKDALGSYDGPFYVSGAISLVCCIIFTLCTIPWNRFKNTKTISDESPA